MELDGLPNQGADGKEDVILVTGYRNLEGKRINAKTCEELERNSSGMKTKDIMLFLRA